MTPHNNHLHDHAADEAALYDLKLESARDQVKITGFEVMDRVTAMKDADFQKFVNLLTDVVNGDSPLQFRLFVRDTVCKDLIEKRAKEMLK